MLLQDPTLINILRAEVLKTLSDLRFILDLFPDRSATRGGQGLRPLVAVQPFRRAPANVARGMIGAGGNKKLLADLQPMYLTVHFKFFFAFDQHHQFIGFMDEVSPHSARRIDPQVAGKATRIPVLLNS